MKFHIKWKSIALLLCNTNHLTSIITTVIYFNYRSLQYTSRQFYHLLKTFAAVGKENAALKTYYGVYTHLLADQLKTKAAHQHNKQMPQSSAKFTWLKRIRLKIWYQFLSYHRDRMMIHRSPRRVYRWVSSGLDSRQTVNQLCGGGEAASQMFPAWAVAAEYVRPRAQNK